MGLDSFLHLPISLRIHENFKSFLVLEEKQNLFINTTLTQVDWHLVPNLSNIAISHVSTTLNFDFSSIKGFRDTKNCQNFKFH